MLASSTRHGRDRIIFEGVYASPARVVALIREEMKLRMVACGGDELFQVPL